ARRSGPVSYSTTIGIRGTTIGRAESSGWYVVRELCVLEHVEPERGVISVEQLKLGKDFARKVDRAKPTGCDDASVSDRQARRIFRRAAIRRYQFIEVRRGIARVTSVVEQASSRQRQRSGTDRRDRSSRLRDAREQVF